MLSSRGSSLRLSTRAETYPGSFFSRQTDGAAAAYERAATCYRVAKALPEAIDAYQVPTRGIRERGSTRSILFRVS